jgi:hypothetical protein
MRKLIPTLLAAAAALALAAPAAQAAPVLDPDNGHYYEYFDAGLSWTAASAAALASDFDGRQGYLATVTDADENAFLLSLGPYGWLGGSDAAVTDEWRWVDGPEAGQLFWLGGPGGAAFGYSPWYPGQPSGGEHSLEMLPGGNGTWNDAPTGFDRPYYVEYSGPGSHDSGGAPEPAAWALMLGGFGLAGAALRRRRRHAAA